MLIGRILLQRGLVRNLLFGLQKGQRNHIQTILAFHLNLSTPQQPKTWQSSPFNTFTYQSLRFCHHGNNMTENRYGIDNAKMGTSGCKKCKVKITKGGLRIAKIVPNPFTESGGDMKQYFHPQCIFETFVRARATTKKIESPEDLEGWSNIGQEDKDEVLKLIKEQEERANAAPKKKPATPRKKAAPKAAGGAPSPATLASPAKPSTPIKTENKKVHDTSPSAPVATYSAPAGGAVSAESERDNSFREYRKLCAEIADVGSYTSKTAIVSRYLTKGPRGEKFEGDVYLLMKLLLPGFVKRVYNINSKQLVKLFSQIFRASQEEMLEHLNEGDVAETVKVFFEQSHVCPPQKKTVLSIHEVDWYLDQMAKMTREDDQQGVLQKITNRCTSNDLKMVIRLIKHDLRINAGAKHILEGLDPNAYPAFQASRDLKDVVERVLENRKDSALGGMKKTLSVRATLMTPVLPMLAEACKSVEYALKKCPNGMYSEIKYDGERVQVHKKGDTFQYFSRSLKPVLPHKVQHFKDFIPLAFPHGNDIILDSEVLLVDNKTGTPLPFGTLGVHKKAAFHDANVCLFIFDCLHFNGQSLMDKPIKTRRKFLRENMTEVPNRIMFSEMKFVNKASDLSDMMMKVFREGLEGLVLKNVDSLYEPGKRHWLKVKKDYLADGAMADTADLVVIGAFYGTGNKGGMMSVFLMGVHDPHTDKWCTVTKVAGGHDDSTLARLQTELDMVKISKDASKVPDWLKINKGVVPDFVCRNPKKSAIWEITGAEFSKAEIHTAAGISIRFPRVTKIRDDKSWQEATNLPRLKELFKKSKEYSDIPDVLSGKKNLGGPSTSKKDDNDSNGDSNSSGADQNGTSTPMKRKAENGDSTPAKKIKMEKNGGSPPVKQIKTEENGSSSPMKKIKTEENGVESPSKSNFMCKYGADCYQMNPEHTSRYDHPAGYQGAAHTSKLLPSVFHGMRLFVPKTVDKYKDLRRYIIAFDGDMVEEYDKATATHVVAENGMLDDTAGIPVPVQWLWECIKRKRIVPIGSVTV